MSRRSTRSTVLDSSLASAVSMSSNHLSPSTLMYMNSQYNHPAFNKLHLGPNPAHNGKGYGPSSAVPKAPKPPEKPIMPYMRYSRKVWDEVKANNIEMKLWEIGKIIGKQWRELPTLDKQVYMEEYETEKLEYQDLLKSYHNSPAYQGFLQAKARAEAMEVEQRAAERDDASMSIEPADDGSGDTDEGFSVKHISAARFQRNHRLMQEILSESCVAGGARGIVTQQRLDVLKNQVGSLDRHQTKLRAELVEIEKKHGATKRKWRQQSDSFSAEMKRLRNLSPEEYYVEYKKQQAAKAAALKEAQVAAEKKAREAAEEKEKKDREEREKKKEEGSPEKEEGSPEKLEEVSPEGNDEEKTPEKIEEVESKIEDKVEEMETTEGTEVEEKS